MADLEWMREQTNIIEDVFRRHPPGANGHDDNEVDCIWLTDEREGKQQGEGSNTTFKQALPFVGFDELEVEVQKPWLLKNVIAKAETSSWIGGPGKGKSALLTDVASRTFRTHVYRRVRLVRCPVRKGGHMTDDPTAVLCDAVAAWVTV